MIKSFAIAAAFLAVHLQNASAQGGVTHYCTSGLAGSHISASGSASFTANGGSGDLVLHADHIGPTAPGRFLFGSSVIQPIPFGNGYRCVSGQVFRLPPVTPAPGTNTSHFALDFLSAGPASVITPGSTWNFQFWFRSGATYDLSDAVSIHFAPPSTYEGWSTISQGPYSGHSLAWNHAGGIVFVENDAQWVALWNEHTSGSFPPIPPPTVDFSQDVVVAAFAGMRSTSGYSFAVRHLDLSVATLDVSSVEHTPGTNCLVLFVITNHFHFVRVPRVEYLQLGAWNRGIDVYACP